ncbi:hypothetical protein [Mycolicibacterium sphagni]|uniref:Uncharacterized protein n=1 Tax=Mycolicibacterium sphagni TaxID=1786 RepID=A0A255DST3_9MYCO|nr:hypothetical protein [Mycolicibacterium sphagni]OYN81751.1 hypothetical protein CG716_05195 [Mycolicibacterium sphagni]
MTESERANEFIGWAYEGGFDTALEMYRERYGDAPNYAVDSPDGGHLAAMTWLKRAVELLEAREAEKRRTPCASPTVRRQDGWNAPASTPRKLCSEPIGLHVRA